MYTQYKRFCLYKISRSSWKKKIPICVYQVPRESCLEEKNKEEKICNVCRTCETNVEDNKKEDCYK